MNSVTKRQYQFENAPLMLDLSKPIIFSALGDVQASELIDEVKSHCMKGQPMHPEALKAVVLKLTYISCSLSVRQDERDTAATLATSLANAALKAYGSQSEFGRELLNGIQVITNNHSAA